MNPQQRLTRFSRSLLMSAGLVVLLAMTFALYVRSEEHANRAHELRRRSFLLADELRQSSDDLTRTVRTYVVTGDPVYKQHYQDILDIRNGKKPRPERYWRMYWDLVLPGGHTPRPGSQQAIALLELMRQAGLTEEEFRKLAEAKANSDALTVPEFKAMTLVEVTGPEAEANRAKVRTMMFDDKYLQAKAAIMQQIDESYVLVDQRTFAAVRTAEHYATALRYVFVAFGLGLMVMLWRTYAALRNTMGGSVDEVYAQIATIGRGDFSSAIRAKEGLEDSVLGWLSETQAKLSDSDRERQLEEERFRLVVEAAPNGIIVVNEAGAITLVNAQTEQAFGYTRAELVGQSVEVLVPERFRASHPAQRRGFFADPKARAMGAGRDLFGRRKDGSQFPLEIGLSPITTREGLVVLAAVVDVTERKRTEAALREAHDELEKRVRERTAELTTTNESLRHEIVQRQQAEGLMQGDQEVMGLIAKGRPLSDILETLARNIEAQTSGALCSILLLDADGVHLRHGAAPSLPEAYNRAIDGRAIGPGVGSCGTAAYLRQQVIVTDIATDPLWANFRGLALGHELRACWSTPIQNADGRVLGTFAIYSREPHSPTPRDFATIDRATYLAGIAIERKQAEEALLRAKEDLENKVVERTAELQAATKQAQAADRLKSAFLATMSHELRTPLNSIIGFTGIILQGLAGPLNPEQAKQLEMVRGSARHLLALINDVLDISKIEAGQLEVCCEPFDLRASITNVTNTVRPLAEKKGLTLNAEVSPAVAGVVSDKRRVEQVLLNLLSNAVKFTDKGGVTLRAEVASDHAVGAARPVVRLSVTDTGMGIKAEDLATLFQPFHQIDSGLARNHEGTGLGLAICKKLAEKLGGTIRAESEWGKGSVFTFTLPIDGGKE